MDLEAHESCGPNITWKLLHSATIYKQYKPIIPIRGKSLLNMLVVGVGTCVLSVLYRMAKEKFRYERIVDV